MAIAGGRSLTREYRWLTLTVARITDIGATVAVGYLCYLAYFSDASMPTLYVWGLMFGALLIAIVQPALGVYRTWRGRVLSPLLFKLMMGYLLAGLVFASLLYFVGLSESFSRMWVISWFTFAFLASLAARTVAYGLLRQFRVQGRNIRHVVLIGDAHSCKTAVEHLRRDPTSGFEISRIFVMNQDAAGELVRIGCGSQPYAASSVYEIDTDEVWICMPLAKGDSVKAVLADLGATAANVRFMPDMRDFRLINHNISTVASLYLLDMSCSPISGSALFVKALEDRLVAGLALLLLSPLMLALALGVKLSSPGPVFYRQERLSWNGKPFEMLKFRSMPVDSEKGGVVWGNARQKQTTEFGAFLRRTSLDELPQLINVIRGEMSIVGPRPERSVFVNRFRQEIPGYMQKHLMKAGITGWAQINGWRGDTDLAKRIECDLWYIENWSVWLDLKIMFLTVFKGFVHKHAY